MWPIRNYLVNNSPYVKTKILLQEINEINGIFKLKINVDVDSHRLEGDKPKKESDYAHKVTKAMNENELRDVVIFHNNTIT